MLIYRTCMQNVNSKQTCKQPIRLLIKLIVVQLLAVE